MSRAELTYGVVVPITSKLRNLLRESPAIRQMGRVLPTRLRKNIATRMGLSLPWAAPIDLSCFDPTSAAREDVAVWGFFSSEIGLGSAARNSVQSLRSIGVECSAHAITLSGRANVQFRTDILTARHSTNLLFVNPSEMMKIDQVLPPTVLARSRRIGHWAWELSQFPKAWLPSFLEIDEVWAGSTFVQRSIAAATNKTVRLAPYAVPDRARLSTSEARLALGLPQDEYIFLSIFDYSSSFSRKNPVAIVDAFAAAFPTHSPSRPLLILKSHSAHIDRANQRHLRQRVGRNTRIRLIDHVMNQEELNQLQDACDCFVSLHRAEGFGLNIAESMAGAKPVIATAYSGNMDFMTPRNSFPLPYTLVPVHNGSYPHACGQEWAQVNHEAAVETLRFVVAQPDAARVRGQNARQDIIASYAPDVVGRLMAEMLRSS